MLLPCGTAWPAVQSSGAEPYSAVPSLMVTNGVLLPCLNRNDIFDSFSFEFRTTVARRVVQFSTCYHPPGSPRDKSGPSRSGMGHCSKQSFSEGPGRGKSKVTFRCSYEERHFSVYPPSEEKIAYRSRKNL